MLQCQQVLEGLRCILPSEGEERIASSAFAVLNYPHKCDTFSRSQEAVLELSMRFAEVGWPTAGVDEQMVSDKERLMFLELTQSPSPFLHRKFRIC